MFDKRYWIENTIDMVGEIIDMNPCAHPIEQRVNCSRGDGVNIRRGEHTQCMACSKFSFQFKITQE